RGRPQAWAKSVKSAARRRPTAARKTRHGPAQPSAPSRAKVTAAVSAGGALSGSAARAASSAKSQGSERQRSAATATARWRRRGGVSCGVGGAREIGEEIGAGGDRGDQEGDVDEDRDVAGEGGLPDEVADARGVAQGFHGNGRADRHADGDGGEREEVGED